MGPQAMRAIGLLWLVHKIAFINAGFSDTGGVTMTEIYTSGQNGAASAVTFYPVLYPGADDLNLMTRSNYSAYTTTAPPYVYGPDDFIDCDSSSLPASGTAPTYRNGSAPNGTITAPTSRTGPITIAPHATITPAIPFEEYWCSSYASSIQDSALLSFQNNGTNSPQFHGLDPSAKTVCMSVEAENYSKWATTHAPSTSVGGFWSAIRPVVWTPTLTPPCCNTFCNLVVPSAQMQYWPTPAPAAMKNRTTLVGPDGFVYTSPSIYVVYKGISATNDCGQTLGSTTVDLTLSYAPSDMITFSNRVDGYTYKTIDFATIWSNCSERYTYSSHPEPPCAKTMTTKEASCGAQISSIAANDLFWREHCYPQLSFPPTTRLQELNTAWKMCDMGNVDTSLLGVFDPPRALKSATAMVAPAPTKTPGLPIAPVAEPASQAVPAQPAKTASQSTTQASNDPSSNINVDPSGPGSPNPGGAVDSSNAGKAPPTQTTKEQKPQQAGDSKPTSPAPINASPADSPVASQPAANNQPATNNQPVVNQSPSDPGAESAAQMSALHQALAPAPAAGPQTQGTAQPNGTPQQMAGSPPNAPASANSPAANGGSQPAEAAPNQNQGANPPSSGPASGGSQPGSGGSQVASGSSHPVNGGSQPVVPAQNQGPNPPSSGPASGGSQAASGGSQPASEGSPPGSGGSQVASGSSQPINGGSQPGSAGSQLASGSSQPVDGGSQPVVPAQNQGPNSPSSGAASGGSQPASGGSQPGSGGSQVASGSSQPVNGGSQPGSAGSQLASGSSQPVDGGSQPVVPAQNQGHNPPSSGAVSNGGSSEGQVAHNQGPSHSTPVSAASPPPQFAISIPNGETLSGALINPSSVIIAGPSGGATVQAGAPATQVLGHTISVGPAGSTAIVDGQVHALTMQTPAAINNNNNQAAVSPGSSSGDSQDQPAAGPDSPSPQQNAGGQGSVVAGPPQPFTTTVANHAIAAVPYSPGAILVDGQTVSHGAAPVIISNTPVAYNSNGNLILGTQTISNVVPSVAPSRPPLVTTTIANHVIAAIPSSPGALLIDGQTISQGSGPTTISKSPVVYHSNGDLVLGTQTISNILPSIVSPPSAAAPVLLTVAGQVASVLPNSAGIIIAGATILPNAPAVAIAGTVSAYYGSAGLLVGTSTIALPSLSPAIAAPTVFTLAGQVATILPNNGGVAIAGTTLQADAPAVSLSGTLSASYGSAGLVVGTSTIALPSISPEISLPAVLTLAGQLATILPNNGGVAIAGTTLQVNGLAVSISGTVSASYGSAGLIVGTSTVAIPSQAPSQESMTSITLAGQVFTYAVPPTPTASAGFNGVIMGTSMIAYTSTGTNGAIFTGTSSRLYISAVIESSNEPYIRTGANGALSTGMSTAFHTSILQASGTRNVGSLILGGLNPSGPGTTGSRGGNGTQTGGLGTSSVAEPTGLAGTSVAGGKIPVSGVGRVVASIRGYWIGAFVAVMGLLWV